MIKQFVIMYVNTITVLIQAIRSASLSVLPDFSPRALAHIRHTLLLCKDIYAFPFFSALFFVVANAGPGIQHHFYNAMMT